MSRDVWVSRRFWFGVGGVLCGAFVASFAGDDSIPVWLVKLFGVGSSTCGGVIMLLQNSDLKAKGSEATREHKAMP